MRSISVDLVPRRSQIANGRSFFENKNTQQSFSLSPENPSSRYPFLSSLALKEDEEDKENVSSSSLINTRGRILIFKEFLTFFQLAIYMKFVRIFKRMVLRDVYAFARGRDVSVVLCNTTVCLDVYIRLRLTVVITTFKKYI